MYRKNFIVSLFIAAVFLTAANLVAFAQSTAPVRGRVQLKKADNTIVPVEGAEITAYRTDTSKGKLPIAKTDKKGYFNFAGVPFGQTFVIVATAPNILSGFFPNVKAGMENVLIEVSEGDGKIPTEEEIRAALSSGSNSTSTTTELSPEEKKKQEELLKKNAEILAKNEKIKNSNEVINRAIAEGKKAYDASDWDTAIVKFNEGYNADPDFPGTAPVFLNNKADALKQRGVASFRKSANDAANKATYMEAMKKDFLESLSAAQRAVEILKTANSTEANVQKGYDTNRMVAYSIMNDVYRLLIETRADESKAAEAVQVIDAYVALEPDATKKAKAQIQMADALRKIGKSDEAIPLYRKALESAPDNADLLAGLGLSLFNSGVIASNKEQMQEGLNIMEQFTAMAPDTHPLKQSVKEAVDYLKTQEKLTPQKTTRPAKKRT